jgi:hypothetical protein
MTTEMTVTGNTGVSEWADEAVFSSVSVFDRDVAILDCKAHKDMIDDVLTTIYENVLKSTSVSMDNLSHPMSFNEKLSISLKTGKKKATLRFKLSLKNADSTHLMDLSTVIKFPSAEFYDELHHYMSKRGLT